MVSRSVRVGFFSLAKSGKKNSLLLALSHSLLVRCDVNLRLTALQDVEKKHENVNSKPTKLLILFFKALRFSHRECKSIFFSNENILIVPSYILYFLLTSYAENRENLVGNFY